MGRAWLVKVEVEPGSRLWSRESCSGCLRWPTWRICHPEAVRVELFEKAWRNLHCTSEQLLTLASGFLQPAALKELAEGTILPWQQQRARRSCGASGNSPPGSLAPIPGPYFFPCPELGLFLWVLLALVGGWEVLEGFKYQTDCPITCRRS